MLNFSKRLVEHVNISRGGLFCFALLLLRHRPVLLFAGNIDEINNVTYSKIKSIFIGKIEDEYLNVCIAICTSKASGYRLQQRVEINAIIDEFCNLNHKHYILFTFCCVAIPAALVALRIIGLPIFLTAESCYKSLEALRK